MQTRHTWLSAQIFPCQFEQIFKNARLSFLLVHLDLCAHIHTLYPLTQGETEHHTFSTVPAMMLFPSGIRMPPRMATTAPNTAPAISPHLLLKQPMVECFSLRLRPYVCLSAWQPVLLLSLCVCVECAVMCSLSVFVSRQQQQQRQAVPSEEIKEQARPGTGTDTSLSHTGTSYKLSYIIKV